MLKVGAKPGDRWSSVPGETKPDSEYKIAGLYKGRPYAVIVGSYAIFVEGFGQALMRSYEKKDDKWLLSHEHKYE